MAKQQKQYTITRSKKPHYTMTCTNQDEFKAYHVIFSGWSKPRQKYHVICENGENGDSYYLGLMTMDQIIDKYNITAIELKHLTASTSQLSADYIEQMTREIGNDQELGAKIRGEVHNLTLKTVYK